MSIIQQKKQLTEKYSGIISRNSDTN